MCECVGGGGGWRQHTSNERKAMSLGGIKGWDIESVGGWKGKEESDVFSFNLKNILKY